MYSGASMNELHGMAFRSTIISYLHISHKTIASLQLFPTSNFFSIKLEVGNAWGRGCIKCTQRSIAWACVHLCCIMHCTQCRDCVMVLLQATGSPSVGRPEDRVARFSLFLLIMLNFCLYFGL